MLTYDFFPIRFLGASVMKAVPFTQPLSVREMDLNTMAMFLSRNLYELNPFLREMKHVMNRDCHLVWYLRNRLDRPFSLAVTFSKMMARVGFLQNMEIGPSWFTGILADSAEARAFLPGGWLEQALRTDLVNMNPTFGAMNVHVELFDGTKAELDAVAVWENRKFWFESTTGDIASDLKKIDGFHQLLGIPRDNCFVVTSGYELPTNHSRSVCCLWDLPAWMDERLPRYKVVPGLDWRYPNRFFNLRMQYPRQP
jgi:hypothetical protein